MLKGIGKGYAIILLMGVMLYYDLPGLAQDYSIHFKHLTSRDGLSHNRVASIFRDEMGFMWFGTLSGLNRYNGYEFKTFYHDPESTVGLPSNSIYWMEQGPMHQIWIGTETGVAAFDVIQDRFVDISDLIAPLGDHGIMMIKTDSLGQIWAIVENYGLRLLGDQGVAQLMQPVTSRSYYAPRADLTGFLLDGSDLLLLHANGDLVRMDRATWQIRDRRILKVPAYPNLQLKLHKDRDGGLWVWSMTKSIGLLHFTGDALEARHYDAQELGADVISAVTEDQAGNIIIAVDHGGIKVVERATGIWHTYMNDPTNASSLSHNSAIQAYRADDGMIWIGTNKGGVSYYYPNGNQFRYFHSPKGGLANDVRSILREKNGDLWLGTDGAGLYYYDRRNQLQASYRHDPNDPASLSSDIIICMVRDGNGLWIGTYHGGLNYFDGHTFERVGISDGPGHLPDESIWALMKDHQGNIWIGSLTGGVVVYDQNRRIILELNTENKRLRSNYVGSIVQDREGKVWIGTAEGITVFNPQDSVVQHYTANYGHPNSLIDNNVRMICESRNGDIWISTKGGVSQFVRQDNVFRNYTEAEGLVSNYTVSIHEDNQANVWIATNKGLSCLKRQHGEEQFENYDITDGLQGDMFNEHSATRADDGEMFFGGINGVNAFYPEQVHQMSLPQKLLFTQFYISNKQVKAGEKINGRVLLPRLVSLTDTLALKYFENSFTLEFAALNYQHPEKVRYRYRLEGFDEEWNETAADQRHINYTNLDPGEYIFHVKASDDRNAWDSREIRMAITVAYPFWQTPWAYLLYAFFSFGLFMVVRKVIVDRERLNAKIQHDQIEAQRLHQLDMLKIRFFTNVSHEFRTPLTLILTPLENLLKKARNTNLSADLQVMHRNARRLLSLVNQLLDFRKMESGQIRLNPIPGDFIAFIQDIIVSFSDLSRERLIPIVLETEVREWQTAFDHDKLEKVLFNLLSNAFKYTHSGGRITITIEDKTTDYGRPMLQLGIRDTGIGISQENLPHLFSRFYQVDHPDNMLNHGSGIGLAITREFVELHSGSIDVQSTPGEGTVFFILLPLSRLEENEDMPLFDPHGVNGSFNREKYTLCIAEDNADFRFYLKDNLQPYFNIIEAVNGREAWKLILAQTPDMVVSDVMMPDLDGIELSRKISYDPRTSHIPVILLTARDTDESRLDGLRAGAIEYITKPFNFEILISRIQSNLNLREQVMRSGKKIEISPAEIAVTSLDEKLIRNALKVVEQNMSNSSFSVQELSREVGVSRGQLYKKMLAITGQTPIEFIRTIRLKRAALLLEKSQLTVAEVAYQVGFANPRYFTKHFKEMYSALPSRFAREPEK